MRILSALQDALDRYRFRRHCEDDAKAYERHPPTEAELAIGEDRRDWEATAPW